MDTRAPEAVRTATKEGPHPEGIVAMTLLAVLVIGCLALWIKQSFDQRVNRSLGDAFGKSLHGTSDSLSRVRIGELFVGSLIDQ